MLTSTHPRCRYLIVLYYQQSKMTKKLDAKKQKQEIDKLKEKYGVETPTTTE